MRPISTPIVTAVCLLIAAAANAADGDRLLKVSTQRGLPPVESVTVYQTKDGKREIVGNELMNLEKAKEVFGDNLPRADKVVITDTRDPGPGEKGHVAVQVASDYRTDMAVPPGTYAVWVVPANGAKAQKVEDNVRVQAGRSVKVGG